MPEKPDPQTALNLGTNFSKIFLLLLLTTEARILQRLALRLAVRTKLSTRARHEVLRGFVGPSWRPRHGTLAIHKKP